MGGKKGNWREEENQSGKDLCSRCYFWAFSNIICCGDTIAEFAW